MILKENSQEINFGHMSKIIIYDQEILILANIFSGLKTWDMEHKIQSEFLLFIYLINNY